MPPLSYRSLGVVMSSLRQEKHLEGQLPNSETGAANQGRGLPRVIAAALLNQPDWRNTMDTAAAGGFGVRVRHLRLDVKRHLREK